MAEKFAIDIASGDIAIENIVSKKWNAKDVYVIQDMISADATKLLDLGAKPFLITCFEAPLYAPFFYDDINKIAEHFNFRLGFGFTDEQSNNIPFHFPSFYLEDMLEIRSWKDRKKVVLVAANKYKTKRIFLPYASNQIRVLRQIKSAWWKIISPAYRKSLSLSLHDRRLEAIEYFASTNELDLFGAGWGNLGDLPTNWVNRLLNLIDRCHLGLCQDKLETISRYRFAICFENMQLSGYVTEKIVDCFVSGVVPLYLGAPDIEKIIPAESFVDIRMFKSFEGVEAYMNQMTECYAMSMIEAGRNYLRTEAGMLHSYEGFAQYVIRLAKSCRI